MVFLKYMYRIYTYPHGRLKPVSVAKRDLGNRFRLAIQFFQKQLQRTIQSRISTSIFDDRMYHLTDCAK